MFRVATRVSRPAYKLANSTSRPVFRSFTAQGPTQSGRLNQVFSKGSNKPAFKPSSRSITTTQRTFQQVPPQFTNNLSATGSGLNYIVGGVAVAGLVGLAATGYANAEANPAMYVYCIFIYHFTYFHVGIMLVLESGTLIFT